MTVPDLSAFYGEYEGTLDAKGRTIVPATFRNAIRPEVEGDGLTICLGFERCLYLWTDLGWQKVKSSVLQKKGGDILGDPRTRDLERYLFSRAFRVVPDKQGRIRIPDKHQQWAELGKELIVVGSGSRMEIWNPTSWERKQATIAEQYLKDLAS